MKIPIVREDYLVDCFKRKKKLPFDLYKVEAVGEASSMVTVKVKGRSAVHESSGLQDTGHILEDGNGIYNTTLSMSDLSTGVNRCVCYIDLSCSPVSLELICCFTHQLALLISWACVASIFCLPWILMHGHHGLSKK